MEPSTSGALTSSPYPDRSDDESGEGVFEIEDYTLASPLERLSADIENQLREWGLAHGVAPKESSEALLFAGSVPVNLSLQVQPPSDNEGGARDSVKSGLPDRLAPKSLRLLGIRAALICSSEAASDKSASALLLSALSLAADAAHVHLPLLVPTIDGGVMGRTNRGAMFTISRATRTPPGLDTPFGAAKLLSAKMLQTPVVSAAIAAAANIRHVYVYRSEDNGDSGDGVGVQGPDALESIKLTCEWDNAQHGGFLRAVQARRITMSVVGSDGYLCPLTQPLRVLLVAVTDAKEEEENDNWADPEDDPQDDIEAQQAVSAALGNFRAEYLEDWFGNTPPPPRENTPQITSRSGAPNFRKLFDSMGDSTPTTTSSHSPSPAPSRPLSPSDVTLHNIDSLAVENERAPSVSDSDAEIAGKEAAATITGTATETEGGEGGEGWHEGWSTNDDADNSGDEVERKQREEKLERDVGMSCKGAPLYSATTRLARAMAELTSVRSVAACWSAFVSAARRAWESKVPLPFIEGPPDMRYCLLHQKLCLLNFCIRQEQLRSRSHTSSKASPGRHAAHPIVVRDSDDDSEEEREGEGAGSDGSEKDGWHNESEESDEEGEEEGDEEDEFYDAEEHVSVGGKRELPGLMGLESGQQLHEPICQESMPWTEDVMVVHSEALAALGTSMKAQEERAKLQSATLLSDMQSFKAANPGCVLADFVRWHSPRDYTAAAGLSQRMSQPNNMWQTLWDEAPAIPAHLQKPLWDAEATAASVLRWLSLLPLTDALCQLWISALSGAVQKLHHSAQVQTEHSAITTLIQRIRTAIHGLSVPHITPPGSTTDGESGMQGGVGMYSVAAFSATAEVLLQHATHVERVCALSTSLSAKLPDCKRLVETVLRGETDVNIIERSVVVRLFGLDTQAPPPPVVREIVVTWEAEQKQQGRPQAARLYVKSDAEELICAQTVLSM